ncbi:MAG: TlpA family protein disulfide reductase [Pseudomonadota bacterium]|nr:TlpA family protein disulfide reductase [Pseudomonadota bacterium]
MIVLSILLLTLATIGASMWLDSSTRATSAATFPLGTSRTAALTPHKSPRDVADVRFENGNGEKRSLADFRGKVVLLNVWATWCGPCRAEMPTLDRLQARLGGADFEVVALSIDRGGRAAVRSFFDETDVRSLAVYVDASTDAQARLGIIGVPTTLLIDRDGREIARLTGPAQWDRQEIVDTIKQYLPATHS